MSVLACGLVFAAEAAKDTAAPAAPAEAKVAGCCTKAAKDGKACSHGCCVEAAKAGKNCEKCGGSGAVATEKKK